MPETFTWKPNLISDLEETSDTSLEYKTLGHGGAQSVNGTPVLTLSFTATFLIHGRAELKALAAFWRARNGQHESFYASAFWKPGTTTVYAPHDFDGLDGHGLLRFADDDLKVSWITKAAAEVELKFHQVFTSIEGSPIPMLYRIWTDSGQVEYFADWTSNILVGTTVYKQARIENDEIKLSLELQNETCKINVDINDSDIAAKLCAGTLDSPAWVEVSEYNLVSQSSTSIFVGRIGKHTDEGVICQPTATLYGGKLDMQFPRVLMSRTCMYSVFNGGCTRNNTSMTRDNYKTSGKYVVTWTGSEPKVILNDLTLASTWTATTYAEGADYFTGGWATTGSGATYQARPLTFSAYVPAESPAQMHIIPSWPFRTGTGWMNVGDTVDIYPGCDGNFSTCNTKFGNTQALMSMPFTPTKIKGHALGGTGGGK